MPMKFPIKKGFQMSWNPVIITKKFDGINKKRLLVGIPKPGIPTAVVVTQILRIEDYSKQEYAEHSAENIGLMTSRYFLPRMTAFGGLWILGFPNNHPIFS